MSTDRAEWRGTEVERLEFVAVLNKYCGCGGPITCTLHLAAATDQAFLDRMLWGRRTREDLIRREFAPVDLTMENHNDLLRPHV